MAVDMSRSQAEAGHYESADIDLPPKRVVSFANDVETIIERARKIMGLGDQERNARLAVHGLYMLHSLDSDTLQYAANLSQRAMVARIDGRQMLTGNRLIAYPIDSDDLIVGPGRGRNVLFGAHHEAGLQAGKLAIGNEVHFAINGPRDDRYDTMAYLAITAPEDDQPTGLHVGIPWDRLERMHILDREQAISQIRAAGQIAVPQSDPVFFL